MSNTASSPTAPNGVDRLKIGRLNIIKTNVDSAVKMVVSDIFDSQDHTVFAFANANLVNICGRSDTANRACQFAALFNDGVGVNIAARFLYGERFVDNLNGTDFCPTLFARLPRNTRVFLLGSPPGVSDEAVLRLKTQFPHLNWVGSIDGYFDQANCGEIISKIVDSRCQLLLVGMGNPKQEIWAHENIEQLNITILCVGAYIDFAAGRFKRAPQILRSLKLEWFYRMLLEPRRLAKRYLIGNLLFIFSILRQRAALKRLQRVR